MIRSIKTIMRQDREPYRVPRRVQDVIPIQCIWPDGIFRVGIKFSKTYRFTDINYKVAGQEDKETMFRVYSELLNSLDCAATTKLTICNRRQSQADFEQSVLMPMREDGLDKYRKEYNQVLMDKATGANGITQEKYVTITVYKRDISEEQMSYITNADAGCGLIKYGSALVPFVNRFPDNTELYRLMTTRPGEGRFSEGRA